MADTKTPPIALVFDLPRVATPGPVPMVFGDASAPALPGVHLVFDQPRIPTPGPVNLVFGDAGDDAPTPGIPDATLASTAQLSGLRARVAVRVGALLAGAGQVSGLRVRVVLRAGAVAHGSARITRLQFAPSVPGAAQLQWDANVSRGGARVELASAWQHAAPVAAAAHTPWKRAAPLRVAAQGAWQGAQPLAVLVRAHWQDSQRLRAAIHGHWQQGELRRGAASAAWQEAVRLRTANRHHWQQGELRRGAVDMAWQETVRLRASSRSHWQDAATLRAWVRSSFGHGVATRVTLRPHWQEAMRPNPGRYRPEHPVRKPCYVPALPAQLLFDLPRIATPGPVPLVFVCDGHGGGVIPPALVVVPAQRTYIMINSIEIRRVDDLAGPPLPCEAFGMQLNRQSWTWSFNATFHASARDAVTPPMGQTVEIEVRVNGQPFRLQIERAPRSRRLPEHVVTTSGRGKAAVLDPQRGLVMSFGSALDRTAHQLMSEVLTVNGVGFGWSVDFGLQDWLVPGGVWMHQGSMVSALADIAGSVGGYLQPHDTDSVMRVLPLWPMEWWRWQQELVPQIELPEGFSEIDETEVLDLPEYNRIFVHGAAGGVFADLTRPGTAGDVLKQPMVVHPLITTIEAAKARARAELSESGLMLRHKMTLPVLPTTGVIKPGTVLRYWDDVSVQRLGIVDSTAIAHAFPVLTQSLEVLSHA